MLADLAFAALLFGGALVLWLHERRKFRRTFYVPKGHHRIGMK